MDLWPLVLTDGALVEATGRVVVVGGEVWFEPSVPVEDPWYPPGAGPAPARAGPGVRVVGVDLDALTDLRHGGGSTEGWTTLTGEWSGGRLVVTGQQPPSVPQHPVPAYPPPPCPPPAGDVLRSVLDDDYSVVGQRWPVRRRAGAGEPGDHRAAQQPGDRYPGQRDPHPAAAGRPYRNLAHGNLPDPRHTDRPDADR